MVKSYKSPNMTSFHRPVPSDAKSAERSRLHAEFVEDGPTAVEGNSMVEWGIAKGLGNDQSTVTREGERERERSTVYTVYIVIVVLGLYPIFSGFCHFVSYFMSLSIYCLHSQSVLIDSK